MATPMPFASPPAGAAMPLPPGPAARRAPSWRFALPLAIGAFAIVLAGVNSAVFDLERHGVPKALVLHATALLCLPGLLRQGRRIAPGIVELLLGAFVLLSAASALFADNRWLAFHSLAISSSGLVLLLAGRRAAASPAARTTALAALGAAATLGAFLGAAQAYGLQLEWLAEERAPGGTFGNRNFLAHLVTIALPLLLLGAVRARHTLAALPPLAALAIGTAAVVLTRSRAAWLAMAISFAIMALAAAFARRRHPGLLRPRRLRLLLAIMAAGAFLAITLPNRLAWRSDAPYAETLARLTDFESGSGRGRILQWRNSLNLAAENPALGVGPGNWFVHYPRVTTPGDPSFAAADPIPTNPWPSSDWVAMLVERGAPAALLLLLGGVAAAIVALTRILIRPRVTPETPWAGGAEPSSASADDPGLTGPAYRDGALGARPVAMLERLEAEHRERVHARAAVAARAVAFLGVLAAAAVAGAFDAVLLLPAPTFFVWTAAGLLLPDTRPVFEWLPRRALRWRAARLGVLLFQLSVVVLTLGQMAAILTVGDRPDRQRLAIAARYDPGSHRVRLLLARRGPCAERLPHARAAAGLMPYHPAPKRALAACGERVDP